MSTKAQRAQSERDSVTPDSRNTQPETPAAAFPAFLAGKGIDESDAYALMAMAARKDGHPVEAAKLLEGAARRLRFEARREAMTGTVGEDALHRLVRYCGQCGRGFVVLNPNGRSFRIDRRFCSPACRQAAYRKRHPTPAKLPRVIQLGPPTDDGAVTP